MYAAFFLLTPVCASSGPLNKNPLTLFLHDSEESERVSELKSIWGSSRLPCGTLTLAVKGIKNAIKTTVDDACVPLSLSIHRLTDIVIYESGPQDANLVIKMNACHPWKSASLLPPIFTAQAQARAQVWAQQLQMRLEPR